MATRTRFVQPETVLCVEDVTVLQGTYEIGDIVGINSSGQLARATNVAGFQPIGISKERFTLTANESRSFNYAISPVFIPMTTPLGVATIGSKWRATSHSVVATTGNGDDGGTIKAVESDGIVIDFNP